MPVYVEKETYLCGKRDLFMWQKRPIHVSKEIYSFMAAMPVHVAKETYSCGKRDLFMWQKRAIKVSTETYSFMANDA